MWSSLENENYNAITAHYTKQGFEQNIIATKQGDITITRLTKHQGFELIFRLFHVHNK